MRLISATALLQAGIFFLMPSLLDAQIKDEAAAPVALQDGLPARKPFGQMSRLVARWMINLSARSRI